MFSPRKGTEVCVCVCVCVCKMGGTRAISGGMPTLKFSINTYFTRERKYRHGHLSRVILQL